LRGREWRRASLSEAHFKEGGQVKKRGYQNGGGTPLRERKFSWKIREKRRVVESQQVVGPNCKEGEELF